MTARRRHFALSRRLLLGLLLATTVVESGCVRRRLLIRSTPPGATVYVDNQAIGVTPCSTSFLFYGTREIRLVKPGFETLTVNQPIPAPWYEFPGLDFVSENLVPREIQDYRTVTFTLTPQVIVPTDQLIAKAQQLREATQGGAVIPAAATLPGLPAGPAIGPPSFTAPGGEVVSPGSPTLAPSLVAPQQAPLSPTLPLNTPYGNTLPPGGAALEPLPSPQP